MTEQTRRIEIPMQTRLAPVSSVNAEARTAELVWSRGAQVRRWRFTDGWDIEEYIEELSMDPTHVRLGRLNNGAPLLNAHNRWDLADVIGVVEQASIASGEGRATVRFSAREEVEPIFRDVRTGIIRNVSIGYWPYKYQEMGVDQKSGLRILRAVDWEPFEISLVPIGADADAGVRAEKSKTIPCEIVLQQPAVTADRKEPVMDTTVQTQAAGAGAADPKPAADQAAEKRAAEAERKRVTGITERCEKHKLEVAFRDQLINEAVPFEEACKRILDKLAERQEKEQGAIASTAFGEGARAEGDQKVQMRQFMSEVIGHRLDPKTKLSEGARDYRYMPLLRMAEEMLIAEGVRVRGLSKLEIATRALMSTSDFANVLLDAMNKRLRDQYMENVPTYRRWARRAANAPDFKNINVIQLGAAPALEKVIEGAEFKRGSLTDGKEVYAILTYGKIISITRQALINDDLNAFDRFPGAFAGSATRLENNLVYDQLLSNPTMSDGVALFHANHGNLPTAAAISQTSLGLARALMRKQTGLASEKLNLSPAFLLTGPDKEQEAYQFTSSQYVPAKPSDTNEFRTGGRTALEPIVDAEVTGNKWFLAANSGQVDTVEYCYLDGSEGVFLESQIGFNVDGVDMKARLDFATKAIDWRGLVYNSGA